MAEMNWKPGMFCWVDLSTSDLGAGMEFYGGLFRWKMDVTPAGQDGSMQYVMCRLNDKEVCGMGELSPPMKEQGVPPVWTSYLYTDDVDASCKKAKELGGIVQMEPMDVMEEGRMAIVKDPADGVFGLWQPNKHLGVEVKYEPGSLCWNELACQDTEKALPFYQQLFDWRTETMDFGNTKYTNFFKDDVHVGGMLQMTEEWGETPSHWMTYFSVGDCDKSAADVEALGGKVCVPPTDLPNIGRFAVINDPQGATFSIIKLFPKS